MKLSRALPLLLFLSLLFPLASQASGAIPGIKETGEWRSMKNYVSYLGTMQNTPATSAQKQVFTNNLAAKQIATNNRVKTLYSRAVQQIVNRDQRAEKKQISKLHRAEKRQLQELGSQRARALSKESNRLLRSSVIIRARFASQISSTRATIRKLRRSLQKTSNPFRRQIILTQISTARTKLSRLDRSLGNQLADAKENSLQRKAVIRSRFASKASSTRAYYQNLVRSVKQSWKKIYKNDLRAAKARRQNQFELVSSLRKRGNGYIASMPSSN